MKLDNKGFAITTALYGTMVLFLMLSAASLGIMTTYKIRTDKLLDEEDAARDIIEDVPTFMIVFDGNGGTVTYDEIEISSNGNVNVPQYDAAKVYRASGTITGGYLYGYNFKGWALTPTGSVKYCAGEEITDYFDKYDQATNTLTLYAVWQRVNPKLQITSQSVGYALYTHTKDDNGKTITDGLTNNKYKCWTYNNPNYNAAKNFKKVNTKSFGGTYDLLWVNTSNHCAQIDYTTNGYNPVIINNENTATKKIIKVKASDIGNYSCGK